MTGWLALVALAIHLSVAAGHFHAGETSSVAQASHTEPAGDRDEHGQDRCATCAILHMAAGELVASSPALPLPDGRATESFVPSESHNPLHTARPPFQPRGPPHR